MSARGNMLAALLTSGVVACGASSPSARPPTSASNGAKLFYTVPGAKHPSPLPLVTGFVGKRSTRMIVDTGASVSVVAAWLARELGAAPKPTMTALDPAGQPVGMVTGLADMTIDGWGPSAIAASSSSTCRSLFTEAASARSSRPRRSRAGTTRSCSTSRTT